MKPGLLVVSPVLGRGRIRQLYRAAERAALRERSQRERLVRRGQQAADTGKRVALLTLAGLAGYAITEHFTATRKPDAENHDEDEQVTQKESLLFRAGMLGIALARWSPTVYRTWALLTAGRSPVAGAAADAEANVDAGVRAGSQL